MSINQFNDEGAVIGYKPTLEYIKKGKSNASTQENYIDSSTNNKIQYSETISSFSSNMPSTALNNINFVIDNIKKTVDKLSHSFKSGDWQQYNEISSLLSALESNNEEYINNFIDFHKNNIKSSIVPELIGLAYDTEQRMKALSEILKELYYGDSTLTIDKIKEIDNSYLQKIQSYESSGDISKVNYLALSSDTILNKSVSMYAFSANRKIIDMSNIIFEQNDSFADTSKENIIKKLFDETNEEIEFRKISYNYQQNVEIMKKTLYNYYTKRQEAIELYDLFNKNKESAFLADKAKSYAKQIENAIVNVNRIFAGNQYFLSEMSKIEREKHLLMNIYATVNYKSEI